MKISLLLLIMFAASLAFAADYEEIRELRLDAAGLQRLDIEAGAGSLAVVGEAGMDEIVVEATIEVPDKDAVDAISMLENDLILSLSRPGDTAMLKAHVHHSGRGDSPKVHLDIRMPASLALRVEDGSGSIVIGQLSGNVDIDDGSGSIRLNDVGGNVQIEDGSGSIKVSGVAANLDIRDGSGSIKVDTVGGTVTVDDGSGSIDVRDVERDLIIIDDGSGSLDYANVKGRVETDT